MMIMTTRTTTMTKIIILCSIKFHTLLELQDQRDLESEDDDDDDNNNNDKNHKNIRIDAKNLEILENLV